MARQRPAIGRIVAALLAVFPGCTCGGGDDAGVCTANAECPGGFCVGGRCVGAAGTVFECRNGNNHGVIPAVYCGLI